MKKETTQALAAFFAMASQPGFEKIFGGDPEVRSPYEGLNDGYELRPFELKDKEGDIIKNQAKYSHLYHNGLRVNDLIFRQGGISNGFKDGYCSLIHYTKEKGQREDGFSFGTHVIINRLGEIVLAGTGIASYPSHCGGNVGKLNDTYYNLMTGEKIFNARCSSGSITSKNYIIVEHRYDWYDKSLPLGVYMLNNQTCEYTKIDEIK